jgi:hypothetical protein
MAWAGVYWTRSAWAEAGHNQVGLAQLIYSAAGPVQIVTATYADVAELDRRRIDRASVVQPFAAAEVICRLHPGTWKCPGRAGERSRAHV